MANLEAIVPEIQGESKTVADGDAINKNGINAILTVEGGGIWTETEKADYLRDTAEEEALYKMISGRVLETTQDPPLSAEEKALIRTTAHEKCDSRESVTDALDSFGSAASFNNLENHEQIARLAVAVAAKIVARMMNVTIEQVRGEAERKTGVHIPPLFASARGLFSPDEKPVEGEDGEDAETIKSWLQLGYAQADWLRGVVNSVLKMWLDERVPVGLTDFLFLGPDEKQPPPLPPVAHSPYTPIRTGQETSALLRAASDGKSGRHYNALPEQGLYFHQTPGEPHRIELAVKADDAEEYSELTGLQKLVSAQDADAAFVVLHVAQLLAPVCPAPTGLINSDVWVDLDDVAERAGLLTGKRGTGEREEIRGRVRRCIEFVERARIVGARNRTYTEKRAGKKHTILETQVAESLWSVRGVERPAQMALFGQMPRRMKLSLNPTFAPLLASPDLAQFLNGGERVAAIAGGKPSGAWARSIGLVLALEWRKKPQDTLDGRLLLTRRRLLETYPPKIAPVADVLNGKNPGEAKKFWRDALAALAGEGVIERQDEAATGAKQGEGPEHKGPNGAELPYKGWQNEWLNTPVLLHPGPSFRENLLLIVRNQFQTAPRNLAASKNKGGRPRKNATA